MNSKMNSKMHVQLINQIEKERKKKKEIKEIIVKSFSFKMWKTEVTDSAQHESSNCLFQSGFSKKVCLVKTLFD